MQKHKNTTFYQNEEPDVFSVGDLWFSETAMYVAEKQDNEIVWVEER